MRLALVLLLSIASTALAGHQFMPENDLHLRPSLVEGIDQETFNERISQAEQAYQDIFAKFGGQLEMLRLWETEEVNAYAMQDGIMWTVAMYGGLARRTTADGFTMVICHEIGHHLAGAVFKASNFWASAEGQSDYFASLSCLRKLWKDEIQLNAAAKGQLLALQGGADAASKCERVWQDDEDRNICYRSVVAGKNLADLLAFAGPIPNLDTPTDEIAKSMDTSHPKAQCRLDTYVAGSLCKVDWLDEIIPGKNTPDPAGLRGMMAAKPFGCFAYNDPDGARPQCWFKDFEAPSLEFETVEADIYLEKGKLAEMVALNVKGMDKASIFARGPVELYVSFDRAPSTEDFDCRSKSIFPTKSCRLDIPNSTEQAIVSLLGKNPKKPVKLTLRREGPSSLCRDHNEGLGEAFPCFSGLSCKLKADGSLDDPSSWCINY